MNQESFFHRFWSASAVLPMLCWCVLFGPLEAGAGPSRTGGADGTVGESPNWTAPAGASPGLAESEAVMEERFGLDRRLPWLTSRLEGSPEPPPPYAVEKTFTNLVWTAPLYIAPEPGTDRLLVVETGGEKDRPSRIIRIKNDLESSERELFMELAGRLIYGLTFHPGYRTNGHLFVFSNGPWGQRDRTNYISRFTVERGGERLPDPASETTILEWRSAGHDGGDLVFGHDGMLYLASGDGTSDSDTWLSGQDLSNLLGTILRIDVDRSEAGRAYSVPADNPFLKLPGARPEIWAYGLRNPWRMTVDKETGHIWAGNNGQDLWETAHLIRPGENHGWSVYEGSHPFYLNRQRGPTPIVKPTIEHHHSEFRSLTGGVVYYGELLPDLNGVYVYGDYSTGAIWGARHDGTRLTWHGELARSTLQIVGFAVDQNGELLVADHAGAIYRLVPRGPEPPRGRFPELLSQTGLFLSTSEHRVVPALIPYSVNAPGWADGARAERFIGLVGDSRVNYRESRGWGFPERAVLVQTLALELEAGNPGSERRLETRVMLMQDREWAGYSYVWNAEQTEAVLAPARGEELTLSIQDSSEPDGIRRQVWRVPSRAECLVCHSRAANFVLGLSALQMNKTHDYGGIRANQLRTLDHIGVFSSGLSKAPEETGRLGNPYDPAIDLDTRARSYLHANCASCHIEAGGGNAFMELEFTTAREKMNLIEARPRHDTYGLANAMLVAPGAPERSVLIERIMRRGPGQMPPLASTVVDREAARLFHDWIADMKPARSFVREWSMEDLTPALEEVRSNRSFESGRNAFRDTGCFECHRFAGEGGGTGPDLTGIGERLSLRDLLESILLPSNVIAEEYAATVIETKEGDIVSGRVEQEDAETIVIRTHPQAPEPIVIQKGEITQRRLSEVSNMPEGTVNVLEKEEILDLLAYLISGGNPGHAFFRDAAGLRQLE